MGLKLISDITQPLKKELFGPNWLSLGVAKIEASNISKERFFFLLMSKLDGKTYIEEYVDAPRYFILIEDNKLWQELYMFFYEKSLITLSIGKELKIAKKE